MSAFERHTFDQITLTGAGMWSWYEGVERNGPASDVSAGHVDRTGWEVVYWMEHPENGGSRIRAVVNHDSVMTALRRIVSDNPPLYVSDTCVRAARDLLEAPEEADFDASTSDQVIQTIAYGHPEFG